MKTDLEVEYDVHKEKLTSVLDAFLQAHIGITHPKNLYHFTTLTGLIGILQISGFWATDYRCLDDTLEFRMGSELFRKKLNLQAGRSGSAAIRALARATQHTWRREPETKYVACLSDHFELESQWISYAGLDGFCLGFEGALFMNDIEVTPWFDRLPIIYNFDAQKKIVRNLTYKVLAYAKARKRSNSIDSNRALLAACGDVFQAHAMLFMSTFKRPEYISEREWRLVAKPENSELKILTRTSRSGAYVNFIHCHFRVTDGSPVGAASPLRGKMPLVEVWAGPAVTDENLQRAQQALHRAGFLIPIARWRPS